MTDYAALRQEFILYLTSDSVSHDRRTKGYNQAIFDLEEKWPIRENTAPDMVMEKFDRAVAALVKRDKNSLKKVKINVDNAN